MVAAVLQQHKVQAVFVELKLDGRWDLKFTRETSRF